jgi:hypothetical protein
MIGQLLPGTGFVGSFMKAAFCLSFREQIIQIGCPVELASVKFTETIVKGIVSRDFSSPVFFIRQLLRVKMS